MLRVVTIRRTIFKANTGSKIGILALQRRKVSNSISEPWIVPLRLLTKITDEASNLQNKGPICWLFLPHERMFWLTKVHPLYSSTIVIEAFIVPTSEKRFFLYSLTGVSTNMSKCSLASQDYHTVSQPFCSQVI